MTDYAANYTLEQLMVIEASRFISDYDLVMVGTGMPVVSAVFAQKTHAPHMGYISESGPMAPIIIPTPISVSDPRLMNKAVRLGSLREVLGTLLQRGKIDVGFLGGAEIDEFANINSTVIGDYCSPKVRFPGSGGANDIASHARKLIIITRQDKRRFPRRCQYITSPGYLDGSDGRKKAGLPVENPEINVVTDLAVMRIDPAQGRLRIEKLMPGVELDRVLENLGFDPLIAEPMMRVEPPTVEQIRILENEVDPGEIYVKKQRVSA